MATETRETFFARANAHFPRSVVLDIEIAYTLAKYAHRWQTRKELGPDGEPLRYFDHPRRTAIILFDEVRIPDATLVICALGHDGPEDTRDFTSEMAEHLWSADVAGILKVLSKTPPEGYLDRFMCCTDWRPFVIKGCDRLDNLRSLGSGTRKFQAKQLEETRTKYYPLFDRMVKLTPPEYVDRVQVLRDTVRATTERLSAVFDAQEVELAKIVDVSK